METVDQLKPAPPLVDGWATRAHFAHARNLTPGSMKVYIISGRLPPLPKPRVQMGGQPLWHEDDVAEWSQMADRFQEETGERVAEIRRKAQRDINEVAAETLARWKASPEAQQIRQEQSVLRAWSVADEQQAKEREAWDEADRQAWEKVNRSAA